MPWGKDRLKIFVNCSLECKKLDLRKAIHNWRTENSDTQISVFCRLHQMSLRKRFYKSFFTRKPCELFLVCSLIFLFLCFFFIKNDFFILLSKKLKLLISQFRNFHSCGCKLFETPQIANKKHSHEIDVIKENSTHL